MSARGVKSSSSCCMGSRQPKPGQSCPARVLCSRVRLLRPRRGRCIEFADTIGSHGSQRGADQARSTDQLQDARLRPRQSSFSCGLVTRDVFPDDKLWKRNGEPANRNLFQRISRGVGLPQIKGSLGTVVSRPPAGRRHTPCSCSARLPRFPQTDLRLLQPSRWKIRTSTTLGKASGCSNLERSRSWRRTRSCARGRATSTWPRCRRSTAREEARRWR